VPLPAFFGLAAAVAPPQVLRTAAVLACVGTIAAIPLSLVDNARQSYQEMHITNLFSTLSNIILFAGLLLAGRFFPTLPAFVAVTALFPLAARLLNAALLFIARPYLLEVSPDSGSWHLVKRLSVDGFSYVGAAGLANVLSYQWPIFYMVRIRPPVESGSFAVYLQMILLVLSFGVSLAQPLWSAVADADARSDFAWIRSMLRAARSVALIYGICGLLMFGLTMNLLIKLWLRQPIQVNPLACWLAGVYLLLAIWEYVHWPFLLGLGAMLPASGLVFLRAAVFAVLVPFAAGQGAAGVMALECASIIFITAWAHPRLLATLLDPSSIRIAVAGSSRKLAGCDLP
jgi:O-antigen/teichoic acid export membrane protein